MHSCRGFIVDLSILAAMLADSDEKGESAGLDDDSVTGQEQLQAKVCTNMGKLKNGRVRSRV
jgi:hypothetical protein